MKKLIRGTVQHILPRPIYNWLRRIYGKTHSKWQGQEYTPPAELVDFGDLRRLKPISELEGYGRGLPVDRHYIEKFLSVNSEHIKGQVLEIGDDEYTRKFGKDKVDKSDILNFDRSYNSKTTIEADLSSAPNIPSDTYDCVIFTQTLQFIYDFHSTIKTLHRILKPGGVLLTTLGAIGNTCGEGPSEENWYWLFTAASAARLFQDDFPANIVEVHPHGNVLAAVSFLHGLAAHELTEQELAYCDPRYQMLITVKAIKNSEGDKGNFNSN